MDHWLYRKRQYRDDLLELWKEVQPRLTLTLPTSRRLPSREDGDGVCDDHSSIFPPRGDAKGVGVGANIGIEESVDAFGVAGLWKGAGGHFRSWNRDLGCPAFGVRG